MIDDLEVYLGVSSEGDFSPTSDQADRWEKIATHYRISAPMLRMTRPMFAGLVGVSALLTLIGPFTGLAWLLLGPTLFVSAMVTALALGAPGGKSVVVSKFREWLGTLSWLDFGMRFTSLPAFA